MTKRLTSSELRVATLVSEGRSNREIAQRLYLSVNTVETYLRRIYGKLGPPPSDAPPAAGAAALPPGDPPSAAGAGALPAGHPPSDAPPAAAAPLPRPALRTFTDARGSMEQCSAKRGRKHDSQPS